MELMPTEATKIEGEARAEEFLELCEIIGAAAGGGSELVLLKCCVIAVCQTNEKLREQFRGFLHDAADTVYVAFSENQDAAVALLKQLDGFFERRGDWSWQQIASRLATEMSSSTDDEPNAEPYDDSIGWGQLPREVLALPAGQEPSQQQSSGCSHCTIGGKNRSTGCASSQGMQHEGTLTSNK
jgi:hypothetical protein